MFKNSDTGLGTNWEMSDGLSEIPTMKNRTTDIGGDNNEDVPFFRSTSRRVDDTFIRTDGYPEQYAKNSFILKRHIADMERFECKLCDKKCKSVSVLERHMLSHTKIKDFACGICGKKFTQKSNCNTHEQWVCGKEKLACTVCGKLISGPTNLEHHLRKTHKMHPSVECKICDISLRGDLTRHNLSEHHINNVEKLRVYQEDQDEYRKERAEALAQLLQALE
jgi:uncharacterized Zn-finger protein